MLLSQVEREVATGWARLDDATVRDRARGCLLAGAVGDAMGAVFEGEPEVGSADYAAVRNQPGGLRFTDDTVMTLVLAEHLAFQIEERQADLEEDELLAAFAWAWRQEPWRGYGSGAQQVLRAALFGQPWRKTAGDLFDGAGSFGNGGAMRVAPVALLGRSLSEVLQWARRSARLTHAHPLGQAGAALQAAAVSLAVSSDRAAPLDPSLFLTALNACHQHPAFTVRLLRIRYLLDDERPESVVRALGHGVAAVESVPAAILAFLRSPDDPAEVIDYAIGLGGDTDTIAAMAGAMAGSRCGATALPAEWLPRIEHGHRIAQVADALARIATSCARNGERQDAH